MICNKTIPTLKLLIVLLSVILSSYITIAQQSPERNVDSVVVKSNEVKFIDLNASLNLNKLQFSKTALLTNRIKFGDTLKKRFVTDLTRQAEDQLSVYTNLLREINSDIRKKIESPFSLNDASLSILGVSSNANNDSLQQNNYNLLDAAISSSFIGIPFSAVYQNHYYPFVISGYQNRLSFEYDKESYLDAIKKKLAGKFNPEDFLKEIGDPVHLLKMAAEKKLRDEINAINQKYSNLLNDKIKQLGNINEIFLKDPESIRKTLFSAKWLEQVEAQAVRLGQLQNQINIGLDINQEEYKMIKDELQKHKGAEMILEVLESHSKNWRESGLIKRIKESGIIRMDMIEKIKNDPSIIRKLAKQKLDLNSLQRLFLSVTKLDIGQTTADFSRVLTGNSLLQGINAGFLLNNKKSLNLLGGSLRTFNSIVDLPFTNSISNNDNRMFALKMQKGMTGGNSNSFSLLALQTFNGNQFPFNTFSLPRRSMIIGFSRQIEINKASNAHVEVSKSSGFYVNDLVADSGLNRNKVNDLLNTKEILKSLAISVNYNAEFEKINLQTESFIRYAGINYDNPVTGFIPSGTKEVGTGLRKLFFEKRLQIHARANWRLYKFSETSGNSLINSSHFIDIKWKMRKAQSVSIRYQPVKSLKVNDGSKTMNGSVERLALTTNLAAGIRSFQYRNYSTLAYQKNIYSYQNAGNTLNKSLQISSMQSIVIGKHVIYSNTSFNKVNNSSAFIFFNTSFNTDLGITYSIGKKISASSSLNYNSIEGWYNQIAIKQSVNGELGRKFKLDVYVDIGKNIKTFQQIPFSLFRAEWSLQYMFNR